MKPATVLQAASNLVAMAVGVFAGLAIAGFPGIETWLEKWQTLVTGVLAIVAATLTVLAMNWIDEKQQLRHEQLVKLGLRSDRLRALRAKDRADFLSEYAVDAPEHEPLKLADLDANKATMRAQDEATAVVQRTNTWIDGMTEEFEHKAIERAYDLLDPVAASNYEYVQFTLAELKQSVGRLAQLQRVGRVDDIQSALGNVQNSTEETVSAFLDFADELRKLGDGYN